MSSGAVWRAEARQGRIRSPGPGGVLTSVESHASGGGYLNFPGFMEEGHALVRASMGGNYERLAALKQRLDPDNLFRQNANVEPAG